MKKIVAIFSALLLTTGMAEIGCTYEEPAALSNAVTEETVQFYQQWKEKYLAQDTYVTNETQYYVWYSEDRYKGDNQSVPVTVSEAHGYGMLIFASMAKYDASAKEYFDGMYRYYKAHPSSIGPHLMSWQQCDNGSALIDGAEDGSMTGGSCDSATDGDMDIAYALLLADAVWGSDGEIHYLEAAKDMIHDIMQYDVNQEYWILTLGDWVSTCDTSEKYYHATRSSDFIIQYLPVFAEVSGDENWMRIYETTYEIITSFSEQYGTGLLPDFIIREASGQFVPAEADFLESEYDGAYSYNSCRTPWRIGMDYVINGNETAKQLCEQMTAFITKQTNRDPWEIMAGYQLDGTAIEDYNDLCFTAPFLIAASCTNDTEWHDTVRDVVVHYGDDVYFGDTIKMLCLIVDDGSWIVPHGIPTSVRGDVNADGIFSIADLVMMQKWMIHYDGITDAKTGDLNNNDKLDAFDLCAMKRMLYLNTGN